ncbi:hypothetical protein NUW58_g8710 [Xylaria curta]|uniref:Uncharacterized protein n=1 Tax=Xylaria curta TaxID=42375 RepID=A0ACC1N5B6_9PEZI|nr:hypothetical protein NUW58_g8710 [Xylaria curta]
MQRTPSCQLPSRPSLTVNTYKFLPDASKADLPPKPLITPTSLSPTQSLFPSAAIAPSPNKTPRGKKRTYSHYTDKFAVPLQTTLTRSNHTGVTYDGNKYHGIGDAVAEHVTKVRRVIPDNNDSSNNSHHITNSTIHHGIKNTAQNNSNSKDNYLGGNMMHRRPPILAKPKTARTKSQLIHDMLLGGARTLSAGDQEYLANQIKHNLTTVSPLMIHLVATTVTNKAHNLSYIITQWAHRNDELELVEYMLEDRLYNFDMEKAFDEGLMDISELSALIDFQTLLGCIRKDIEENARRRKAVEHTTAKASVCEDHYESDTGSVDMDLSE